MPVIDGLMFCRELRLRGHKEPIVVYSAGALPEDRKRGLEAGADAYVVKPDNSQLVGTVRMLLSRSDLPEAERPLYHCRTDLCWSASSV
jgi:DNA-binding response OmpR family regulator